MRLLPEEAVLVPCRLSEPAPELLLPPKPCIRLCNTAGQMLLKPAQPHVALQNTWYPHDIKYMFLKPCMQSDAKDHVQVHRHATLQVHVSHIARKLNGNDYVRAACTDNFLRLGLEEVI